MFEQDFLDSLPDDEIEAFPIVERYLNEHYLNPFTSYNGKRNAEKYIAILIGYLQAHELNIGISFDIPYGSDEFRVYMDDAENKISIAVSKLQIQSAWKNKAKDYRVLNVDAKQKIHTYIRSIRELILKIDLTDLKRSALSEKLTKFENEVDRDKTKLEMLGALMMAFKKHTIEDDRVYALLDKAIDVAAKSPEWTPKVIEIKKIEQQHKIEDKSKSSTVFADDLDSEIPF